MLIELFDKILNVDSISHFSDDDYVYENENKEAEATVIIMKNQDEFVFYHDKKVVFKEIQRQIKINKNKFQLELKA